MNPSNNLITVLDLQHTLKNLQELNLRKNFISNVRTIANQPALQRLYLSNNKLSSLENLNNMPVLSEITLENNPIEKLGTLLKDLRARFPTL